ncbi:MAG: hypothetical protein A2233_02480 [Candidatus Kerfeldbacteria bacterium RIFOXYA2_FULL_38_24]|uniref:Type 4 fimbrial biogenesis protein PilX N-terminal domain-containing protein n=1 Tax=Candidatus Kerfeldbacteria bacterium RIFOXYB2_FULL_38_14 TaxID=1798547 RepID=A0A1G2B9D4_9BACT|nr:MAG: hypothetical protein A2233_02480 [Candidatus Kerfeldbacteria bacterium RIFOXYA2_FULL_38_24]OGY85838.1 MAG: hypothetical protein A2319_05790 [Candidatus Kerfeldbacteria bacterium RIFOXYB2_FULL_38_14]OGY89122.1 MAG: hypothetical protein A2458_02595 [Candidatus Kerfeldbacteria bacterium RIFOXYC2_FULL_38_9]
MKYSFLAKINKKGSALLLTLFFSALFLIMFGAIITYISTQHKAVQQEINRAQAINVAEAGVAYYRWHLAHLPDDYSSNTGEHVYKDRAGKNFGVYDVSVQQPSVGSTVAQITANAYPAEAPQVKGRVRALYGKPTLAHYAFLTNSNVWFGDTEKISGELHANGGVRMDGIGDSILSSAQQTYICGQEHGCNNEEKPGIWGTGQDASLWRLAVEPIDFNAILLNLETMKTDADADGIYLPDSGSFGYFVEFHANATLTIYTVTAVANAVDGYNGTKTVTESIDKTAWLAVPNYENIPLPHNGLIFLEDDVWVSGQVNGRVTLAAARLPDGSFERADIYLQNDLTYITHDGHDVLGLIGQEDILATFQCESDLIIDASLIAVHGHVYRYYYQTTKKEPYKTYALRDKIKTYGSIITNTTWTWSWVTTDGGPVTSGFQNTETVYDPNLTYAAPPSFPTENQYVFISWEELELKEE